MFRWTPRTLRMRRLAIVAFVFSMGCFPYREKYRPEIDSIVVDTAGKPLAGVRVETCSATHWNPACRYHASGTTDSQGHFHLAGRKEWEWCCLGEAPLPFTIVAACGAGQVASTRVTGARAASQLVLGGPEPAEQWALDACAP